VATTDSWATSAALVYVYLWIALFAICVTVLHVQVSTRFLSSACPALYWYAGSILAELRPPKRSLQRNSGASATTDGLLPRYEPPSAAAWWLKRWSQLFIVLGSVLFSAFLPWT
jgi:hypothetical protein